MLGILLLLLSWVSFTLALAATNDVSYYPSWQSVYPDTNDLVIVPSNWSVSSLDGIYDSLGATVPGDILSDLSDIIGDVYYDRNLWTQRHVWMGNTSGQTRIRSWMYETKIPPTLLHSNRQTMLLVIEGIKMGARILWNDEPIGIVTNQFLRYRFLIPHFPSDHTYDSLKIIFDPTISTMGRFMGCSGGWDWAPYAQEMDARNASRVLTFGIVQPIYIVPYYESVLITDVIPQISYLGEYPREPLTDSGHTFRVEVTVRLSVRKASTVKRQIQLTSDFSNVTYTHIVNSTEITMVMMASNVKLWWPNGMGDQALYNIHLSILSEDGIPVGSIIRKRIGFRTLALVTANDTDDSILRDMIENNVQGSGGHGMFFRINGAAVWSRGANVIPMDQLEGRITGEAARLMVQSAAKANMNMLRVWGGGSILPREFYDACDEEGIMLYHDLMFVEEQNHGATNHPVVGDEIQHIVRKLVAHPSIVLWNGCNECGYFGDSLDVYESFVMVKVAEADRTRPIWPSSPSAFGWETGVRMLDGLPNGEKLKIRTNKTHEIERHGPYVRGFSVKSPSVNGVDRPGCNETMVPTNFTWFMNNSFGAGELNCFVSEFGASAYSSFESMSVTIPRANWGIHAGDPDKCRVKPMTLENVCNGTNPMAERNYAADNRIDAYFGSDHLDEVGEDAFSLQLYQSMMAQALWVKGKVAMMRARNSFGNLIWQLNENWPTGGWGALEYGPNRHLANQVAGGRWKPLMHVLQRTSFRDVTINCGAGFLCYAVNDSIRPANVTVTFEAWSVSSSQLLGTTKKILRLPPSRGIKFFELPKRFANEADILLHSDEENGHFDVELQDVPKQIRLKDPTCAVNSTILSQHTIQLHVTCTDIALYIWLSTAVEGWFSDNAFHLRPGLSRTIIFSTQPRGKPLVEHAFHDSFKVFHLGSKGPQKPFRLESTSIS